MRKILLVVLSASLLLSGCTYSVRVGNKEYTNRLDSKEESTSDVSEKETDKVSEKETDKVSEKETVKVVEQETNGVSEEETDKAFEKEGDELPTLDIGDGEAIHYIGDLDNKTGDVSFILDDVTSQDGFLVGTFKFKDANGFNPVVESEGDYSLFDSSSELADDRTIKMRKDTSLRNHSNILIYDTYWGTEESNLSDYSILIGIDKEPYPENVQGEEYFTDNYVTSSTLSTFKHNNFYVNVHKTFDDNISYTAVYFIKGYKPVIEVRINSEFSEVNQDKVCEILDCLEFEYVANYDNIDSSKFYYEDAAADFIYKKFGFIFSVPSLIQGIDASEIVFIEPVTSGVNKVWTVTHVTYPEEPNEANYMGELVGYKTDGEPVDYKYYSIAGGYEMYFVGESGDMRSLKVVTE